MNMKSKVKWFALGALATALIMFSTTAESAGTEDVLLGVVAGYLIGDHVSKGKMESPGSASYIDLTQYNVTMVSPDGTLVLTPIGKSKSKKGVAQLPPCARSLQGYLPTLPGQPHQRYWIPKCPNWNMPYGGLIVPN